MQLLQPGRNCWRIEQAHRFSLLIDADSYFRALRAAIRAARHSIFILGWDIDSRLQLVPEGANDGYPEPLGDFLHAVVAANPQLHAYVLNWDFAMLYALEREWLPVYKLGWRTHRRLQFFMDGKHPSGASHHQKVVVIDDAIAFVGGLDLTRCRWDTPEHACDQPLRHDASGKPYAPFHDVHSVVDGPAARALGELCRQRWQHATGKEVPMTAPSDESWWPPSVEPDLTEIAIGIARTAPAFEHKAGIYEVRQLHLDAIAHAQRMMFFENQYFTSNMIGNALAARLSQADAPEVLIVTPENQSGWLEEATMGVLRSRVHHHMKAADAQRRYRLCCPHLPGLNEACLNVHSKVFAIDDTLFSVGSANLSNRSMAFDTECNLVIEASGEEPERRRIGDAIARMRSRLLAEHTASVPDVVMETTRRLGSLHAAVDALSKPGRRLQQLTPPAAPVLNPLIPQPEIFDSEKPIDPDQLVAQFVPDNAHRPVPRRLVGIGIAVLALAALAVAWRWTPLKEWVNLASLIALAQHLNEMPLTPLAVLAGYAIAGLIVPITLLIAATGIVFGPVWGAIYAIAGVLLSATTGYWLGHWLGRDAVRRLLGPRINHLSQRIAKRGIVTVLFVRLLPVAPFVVINVVGGASHLRFRDYLLGTLGGMAPGIILTVTFVHNLAEAARRPSLGTMLALAAVALLLIGGAVGLQKIFAYKKHAEAR